jgi:SAM-dependent methyltransferase
VTAQDERGAASPPSFFDAIYAEAPDPWSFATSEYEAAKYATTVAALPKPRYRSGLEIGCSIGVLTRQLAGRCDALLSIDVAERVPRQAVERCADLPHVRFALLRVPPAFPEGEFDLVVVSEVGYYWSAADLRVSRDLILEHLAPGGHLLLVHWTVEVAEYPITGDDVHGAFFERADERDGDRDAPLRHLRGLRERTYRLDLFERR